MNQENKNSNCDAKMIEQDYARYLVFATSDEKNTIKVRFEDETLWLTQQLIADLFQTSRTNIVEHIRNIYQDEELQQGATCRNFRQVRQEGSRSVSRELPYYNLDMIIAVGYRVNSKRATRFRQWATGVLREYILQGYAANQARLQQLGQAVKIMKRIDGELDAKQILSVIEQYASALTLLDDYDHQCILKPAGHRAVHVLEYEECRKLIDDMRFNRESTLFGREKDDSFRGSIGNIYQSFAGKDLYPTAEEKAANLLYFVTKNHSFLDGNKRIAAAVFLYFLEKNGMLFRNGMKRIEDHTLVAVIVMIAESNPEEKETMVKLVMNFLAENQE